MKAIQMIDQGGPEVLQLVELPDPVPGEGQVLIDVEAASVNFSDIMRRRGDVYPVPTPLPFVPGAEVAGTIVSVSDDVTNLKVGMQVFGTVGDDASGGYAELAVAYARNVIPIPPGLGPDAAAGIVVSGLAATMILADVAHLGQEETVFIPAAAGGVGSYAIQIARQLGASCVIAGAGTSDKREAALGLGADHAVDYVAPGWAGRLLDLTGGRGIDVALEMTGSAHFAETLAILAPFGRAVVYGSVTGSIDDLDVTALRPLLYDPAAGQSLVGFNLGAWFEHRPAQAVSALQRLVGWVAAGTVTTPAGHPMPLAQAAEAHRLLETGASMGKIILKP